VDVNRQSIGRNLSGIEQNKEQISQLRVVVQSQAVTLARIDENIKAIRSAVEEFRKQD
jgi:predicted Zn-dependent protease